jgi:hypothetical protein
MRDGGGGGAAGLRGATGVPVPGAGCRFEEKSGMLALRPFRFIDRPPEQMGRLFVSGFFVPRVRFVSPPPRNRVDSLQE